MSKTMYYRLLYRPLMRFAHRHGWHHMEVSMLSFGAKVLWCHWCGAKHVEYRQEVPRRTANEMG